MDILETNTPEKAEELSEIIHEARAAKYHDQVVVQPNGDKWIYPKNSSGAIDWTAQPTMIWAEPIETPDETYVIPTAPDVAPDYPEEIGTDYGLYERPNFSGENFSARFDETDFDKGE